ncbi:MAG: tetratricopeptide repeat protein [Prochloraceae cyanobacterium]|nr:tetratricopeptide repeat protein [Prochloraceae cyanobacterium]
MLVQSRYEQLFDEGVELLDKKQYKEALNKFQQAIDLNNKFIQAWVYKGICLEKLERYPEAIQCYEKALEINPDVADLWYNKGATYCKMKRYGDALQCLNRVIEIEPDRPFVQTMRSMILEIPPVWSQPQIKPDREPDKVVENSKAAEAKLRLERNNQTYTNLQKEMERGD